MKKKLVLFFCFALVLSAVLSACSKSKGAGGDQVFRMNVSAEVPTLDPSQTQDQSSMTVMIGLFEGLTRMDNKGSVIPGVAEKWDVSDDGKKYTFHLRTDAKWSNGDPVTAADFEFSWKRTLDPKLSPPAPYAYQLFYIKNAGKYNGKEITDANQLGVKAIDEHTLQVELENPTPYFLSLCSFVTYFPIHKSAKDNAAWAAEAKTFVGNGPFKLASWKHGNMVELAANENYYDKKSIQLKKVQFVMIKDAGTEFNMYNQGQLDWAGHPTGNIPPEQLAKARTEKNPELQIKGIASTYYYNFNTTKKPFTNLKIRKALAMAIDRQKIVDQVTKGGQMPAYGFVSTGIRGENDEYRKEVKDDYFKEDVTQAKQLLAEGLQEEGLTAMPEFSLSFNEGLHQNVAEAIADMWKTNLGVKVKLELQEWKVFLKNRTALNYDVSRAGWGADYNDPMTFIDMYTSTSGNNDIGFKNPEYDALVKEAYATSDAKKRMESIGKAEKLLIDNMGIMPIYYYTSFELIKPYVKDVIVDYAGNIDYTRAYIKK